MLSAVVKVAVAVSDWDDRVIVAVVEILRGRRLVVVRVTSCVPAPRDFTRWRFRHRWLGLIEEIITARQEKTAPLHPERGAASDLLDLMATDPVSCRAAPRRRLADQELTVIFFAYAHAREGKASKSASFARVAISLITLTH